MKIQKLERSVRQKMERAVTQSLSKLSGLTRKVQLDPTQAQNQIQWLLTKTMMT
jgi:hypothetical protein